MPLFVILAAKSLLLLRNMEIRIKQAKNGTWFWAAYLGGMFMAKSSIRGFANPKAAENAAQLFFRTEVRIMAPAGTIYAPARQWTN